MVYPTLVIAVPDLTESAAFYRDVLGFGVHDIGDPGWRLYLLDACRIMAGACPQALPPAELGDHSYFLYLTVDDVDVRFAALKDRCEIIKPLRDEPWQMREFGLRTVDGHRIMVGQKLPVI
jgi:catechol 2,3-dioxygenase-like lactoylglutathione lyase family enzyme